MDRFLYPQHPIRCAVTGPSQCGKSCFLSNLILISVNTFEKKYTYSPSLHQNLYQKLFTYFTEYIRVNIIPNILNEEYIVLVIDEIVNDKNFEKSDTGVEIFESIEELKYTQDYEDDGVITLDELNDEKKMINLRVQSMFKISRHIIFSISNINQDYHGLPKQTIQANGNVYHNFKPKKFKDVQKPLSK